MIRVLERIAAGIERMAEALELATLARPNGQHPAAPSLPAGSNLPPRRRAKRAPMLRPDTSVPVDDLSRQIARNALKRNGYRLKESA